MKFSITSDADRKIHINMDSLNAYASRWKPGTEFDVTIVRRDKSDKSPIRKYYFSAVLPPFMEHLGYDRDETELFHRQLKIVYFQVQPDKRGIYRDKDIPDVFSEDSELPVSGRVKFLDWVVRKAAQYGVYIEPSTET